MSDWRHHYESNLQSAEEAVAAIPEGALILQGNAVGEPRALLAAIAARARAGGWRKIRMGSLLPTKHSAETILAPDLAEVIEWLSFFASGVDRARIGNAERGGVPGSRRVELVVR